MATKPVAAKVSKPAGSRFAFLERTQVTIGAIFSLLAVLAGYFVNTDSVQVLMSHLAKDDLASRAGTVLAPAASVLYEVEFRWLLVTLLVTAAVIAFLRGTRYNATEQLAVSSRTSKARWIEFGITGALAFEIVALLNGVQDAVALKVSLVSILVAAYLAWLYEREHAVTGKASKSLYSGALVLVAVPVLALVATMASTYFYAEVRSGWYAYAAAAVVSFGLIFMVRTARRVVLTKSAPQHAYFVNRKYTLISVVTKVALAVVIITGLLK